jgi:hypothetical protein
LGDGALWGWEIVRRLGMDDDLVHQWSDHCVPQFKVLLDETESTVPTRAKLQVKLGALVRAGFIKEHDVIRDFFVKWFNFARDHGVGRDVEFPDYVICAPSAWSVDNYHR